MEGPALLHGSELTPQSMVGLGKPTGRSTREDQGKGDREHQPTLPIPAPGPTRMPLCQPGGTGMPFPQGQG